MEKTILVTGGAGYIGTNVVNRLAQKNFKVIVVDNFSNSYHKYINSLVEKYPNNVTVFDVDISKKQDLEEIFSEYKIDVVIHLAGKKYIAESFEKEDEYYFNNITATEILLNTMTKHKVNKIVFSSSITVYGNKQGFSIKETRRYAPISPYAEHKMLGEKMIKQWTRRKGNSAVVLRLSNPIGADEKANLGENSTSGRKGLLPYLIDCAIESKNIVLNGNSHPTRDGTTIRDYVHVMDVASAFVKASETSFEKDFEIFNIGTGGEGFTVLEVLKQTEFCLNKKMDYSFGEKRIGDASVVVSDIDKAKNILKYKPTKKLKDMVESQYLFQNNIKSKKEDA